MDYLQLARQEITCLEETRPHYIGIPRLGLWFTIIVS